jgi:hypothetical protein
MNAADLVDGRIGTTVDLRRKRFVLRNGAA